LPASFEILHVKWFCMKKQNLAWLAKKTKALRAFDGSLIKYVDSSKEMKKLASTPKATPKEVLKLDSNENLFVSADFFNSMLKEVADNLDLRVYDPHGSKEIKEALAKYVGVPSECIIVCSGSEQLIDSIVDLFVEKGDNVVSIEPSFYIYQKRVALKNARFLGVPLRKDLSLSNRAILSKSDARTRLVFVCSPNNPTGNEFKKSEIEDLADRTSALVVVDEAYAEFGDSFLASSATTKQNLIVLRTFSKAFGLAGLRFGFAIASPDLASTLSNILPYTVNTITSKFVVKLLHNASVIENCVKEVKAERRKLIRGLRSIRGIHVFDSKANFVTFRPARKTEKVHAELLKRGILVKNLGDLPVIGSCLRVTVGLPSMNRKFLKALSEIMAEY